jgi:hypothetical protein
MTTDISSLHGTLYGSEAFSSSSNSTNLCSLGLYRYMDVNNKPHIIKVFNNKDIKSYERLRNERNIDDLESFIGYPKVIMFDKPAESYGAFKVDNVLIPKFPNAKSVVERLFNSAFTDVYESIDLNALVTKPLKEWGSFFVAFEEDGKLFTLEQGSGTVIELKDTGNYSSNVRMPDRYLYQRVEYKFDIEKNLITASITASKKAIQTLD